MTVREEMHHRMAELLEKEVLGDFGARITRFGIMGAMERMTDEELDKELIDE